MCIAKQQTEGSLSTDLKPKDYFPPSFSEPTIDCGLDSGPVPILEESTQEWFANEWRAACELSFFEITRTESPPDFALRFSYFPSFSPTIFISVYEENDRYFLVKKEMDYWADTSTLDRSSERVLSANEVREMKMLLAEERLFDEPPRACVGRGFDGTEMVFELIEGTEYSMVNRLSPTEGPAYNVARFLLELGKVDLD